MKILFICKANHGRSQIAEAIFKKLSGGKYEVSSAGTKVITEEKSSEGQKISDPIIIKIMDEIGVDVRNKLRNQLTPKMFEEADKVVVMAEPETFPEYLKKSEKTVFWNVPDPYHQSLESSRGVRDHIQALVTDFIKTLG